MGPVTPSSELPLVLYWKQMLFWWWSLCSPARCHSSATRPPQWGVLLWPCQEVRYDCSNRYRSETQPVLIPQTSAGSLKLVFAVNFQCCSISARVVCQDNIHALLSRVRTSISRLHLPASSATSLVRLWNHSHSLSEWQQHLIQMWCLKRDEVGSFISGLDWNSRRWEIEVIEGLSFNSTHRKIECFGSLGSAGLVCASPSSSGFTGKCETLAEISPAEGLRCRRVTHPVRDGVGSHLTRLLAQPLWILNVRWGWAYEGDLRPWSGQIWRRFVGGLDPDSLCLNVGLVKASRMLLFYLFIIDVNLTLVNYYCKEYLQTIYYYYYYYYYIRVFFPL